MTRRSRAMALLLGAAVLALSACSGGGESTATGASSGTPSGDPSAEASTDGSQAPEPSTITQKYADLDYVALGDSYSAGPFIGTMRTDPDGCARSKDNYPAFLAAWLGVASYTDVTCSAATTADLTRPMEMFDGNTVSPQLDAVSTDTDLVTLGMGGNDFGIYDSLIYCQSLPDDCPIARLQADVMKVAGNIEGAVDEIRQAAAPDVEIYVVGYPQILPESGTCGAIGASARSLAPVVVIAEQLNGSLARGAKAAGATYIDLAKPSRGHDVCAKDQAWINGPKFQTGIAAPYHPTIEGMRAMAAATFEQITGEQPEITEFAEPDPAAIVENES